MYYVEFRRHIAIGIREDIRVSRCSCATLLNVDSGKIDAATGALACAAASFVHALRDYERTHQRTHPLMTAAIRGGA